MNAEDIVLRARMEAETNNDGLFTRLGKTKYEYYKEGQIICGKYYGYFFNKLKKENEIEKIQLKKSYEKLKEQIDHLRKVVNEYKAKRHEDVSISVPATENNDDIERIMDEIVEINGTDEYIIAALDALIKDI